MLVISIIIDFSQSNQKVISCTDNITFVVGFIYRLLSYCVYFRNVYETEF